MLSDTSESNLDLFLAGSDDEQEREVSMADDIEPADVDNDHSSSDVEDYVLCCEEMRQVFDDRKRRQLTQLVGGHKEQASAH